MPWIIVGAVMAGCTLFTAALILLTDSGWQDENGFHYGKEEDEDHVV